jgi:hypothetical protein
VGTEGAFRGHEGFRRFRADTWDHYDTFEPHYDLNEVDGNVLSWGVVHVRGKGSGVEMDVPSAGIFELRDGLIVRWQDLTTKEQVLDAAGLGSRRAEFE